jgi:hypothetical protein
MKRPPDLIKWAQNGMGSPKPRRPSDDRVRFDKLTAPSHVEGLQAADLRFL